MFGRIYLNVWKDIFKVRKDIHQTFKFQHFRIIDVQLLHDDGVRLHKGKRGGRKDDAQDLPGIYSRSFDARTLPRIFLPRGYEEYRKYEHNARSGLRRHVPITAEAINKIGLKCFLSRFLLKDVRSSKGYIQHN